MSSGFKGLYQKNVRDPQSVYKIDIDFKSDHKLSDDDVSGYLELLKSQYPDLAVKDPKVDANSLSFELGSIIGSVDNEEIFERLTNFLKHYTMENVDFDENAHVNPVEKEVKTKKIGALRSIRTAE